MKKLYGVVIILTFMFCQITQAQPGQNDFFEPDASAKGHKEGEILVKFKEDAGVVVLKSAGLVRTNRPEINSVTQRYSVSGLEPVFTNAPPLKSAQFITLPDGTRRQLAQLSTIYRVSFDTGTDVLNVLEEFKNLESVEYAELNGTARILGFIPQSGAFDIPEKTGGNKIYSSSQLPVPTPSDPYYGQQWYIPEIKADSLWGYTTGDTSQVIAILDTGVDWLHPDLKNKIWTNYREIPNNGKDDDGNGFIDDVRGWDFVNKDNDPKDDNSHGTHCAGIAGAESDNGIGISGVSWGAKIMPVKVFQSNGIGYFSQIAEGFWYAAKNGATIFSNSWMSSGESMTIRLAMEYAYAKGLIVAAAGNMNTKTDLPFPPWPPYEPNFPACYNWVLGVEATMPGGGNTWFSNFDPTGPVISDGRPYGSIYYNDYDYNYELRAPGLSFISTVPNGQYRSYSGTSMATPLAAGAIALMKSIHPDLSNEEVFVKLIQPVKINKMQAGVMNIKKSTFTNPPPDLYFVKYEIGDSKDTGGDNDGRADAGETVDVHVFVKNAGGLANNVKGILRFAEFEDRTVGEIITDTCYVGSISPYASKSSVLPFLIKINEHVADARIISFNLFLFQEGEKDTIKQSITITVEHGIEIKGSYTGLLHLKAGAYYIVSEVAVIDSLLIDPGVTLRFKNTFFYVTKYLSAIGRPDSMITFKGADNAFVRGIITDSKTIDEYQYCIFQDGVSGYLTSPTKIHNSIFRLNGIGYNEGFFFTKTGGDYKCNLFIDNINDNFHAGSIRYTGIASFKYNIITNNRGVNTSPGFSFAYGPEYPRCMDSITHNVFMSNEDYDCSGGGWPMGIYKMKENYWGTTQKAVIHKNILDFYENQGLVVLEVDTFLTMPPAECHGIVWKVEINDMNPQYTPLVIGEGLNKFSVYFNRPMDPAFVPFLTFGVRFPYTQNLVADSASWSEDRKVWTAYAHIGRRSGDGENTIRVAHARDLEHFEIPIERSRFKFSIQAASSQSIDFMATPGIGKVYLEWPKADSDVVLGYNLYRFGGNGNVKDTLKINTELLTDSLFTDFNVVPDSVYYYMFTMTNTDFSESDFSKVVSAKVLSAPNGDANGDLAVNVLDVTTIIAYLLNQDPKPFIFDAADVNGDGMINILDVVATINLVLNPQKSATMFSAGTVNLYLRGDTLYADSPVAIGGIQFDITGIQGISEIEKLEALNGFESASSSLENSLRLIVYSMTGRTIAAGNRIPLLKLKKGSGITNAVMGDKSGAPLTINFITTGLWNLRELGEGIAVLGQNYPNPFERTTTIPVTVNEPVEEVRVRIVSITGQEVAVLQLKNPAIGENLLHWQSGTHKGLMAYVLEISRNGQQVVSGVRKMIVK